MKFGGVKILSGVLIWLIVTLVVTIVSPSSLVQAANLSQASIRLSRTKANTAPGAILVLARPTTTATENQVAVHIASGYSVSGSTGAYGVSTANLPSGISNWPGIGTPTNISGNTVTFPSDDLSPGTTYGFYITSGIGSNPSAGDGAAYLWSISTQNSGSVIDNSQLMIPIVTNDQIIVTGTVPAQSSYFSSETQLLNSGSQFAQYQELEYKITYGSTLAQSSDLKLQATWSLGTVEGSGYPSVDILEYKTGSATTAYNSTPATIDVINRTITWDIQNFPANTTAQTVQFTLKTKKGYTGSVPVSFSVGSAIIEPVVTTSSEITNSYRYNLALEPTPAPTATPKVSATPSSSPSPTATSTTATSPLPSPTSQPTNISTAASLFSSITFNSISTSQASINVSTSTPTALTLSWGTSSTSLTETMKSPAESLQHQFNLDSLQPQQNYFFRLSSTDGSAISDIYTFKTALSAETPIIKTITISHRGVALNRSTINDPIGSSTASPDSNNPKSAIPLVSVPLNATNEFNFTIEKYHLIKELYIELRGPLGSSPVSALMGYSATRLQVQSISPGEYVVSFLSPAEPGIYDIVLQLSDIHGNYTEKTISQLNATPPITILNKKTGKPLERARVEIGVYDFTTRLFDYLDRSFVFPEQQNLTNSLGQLDLALPLGRYQLEVSAIGFNTTEVTFELNGHDSDEYPLVYLEPQPFNIMAIVHYYYDTGQHFWIMNLAHLKDLGHSNDALKLTTAFLVFILGAFSFVALLSKTQLSMQYLTHYLFAHWVVPLLKLSGRLHQDTYVVHGNVISATGNPVSQASVILIDPSSKAEICQVTTNALGLFHVALSLPSVAYIVTAPAHQPQTGQTSSGIDGNTWSLVIALEVAENPDSTHILRKGLNFFTWLLGELFEVLLVLTILLQVVFVHVFGLVQVIPAILLTILVILIWLTFKSSRRFIV